MGEGEDFGPVEEKRERQSRKGKLRGGKGRAKGCRNGVRRMGVELTVS